MPRVGEIVSIQFNRPSPPYQTGDIAGFSPDVAKAYLKAGLAQPYKAPKKDAKAEKNKMVGRSNTK